MTDIKPHQYVVIPIQPDDLQKLTRLLEGYSVNEYKVFDGNEDGVTTIRCINTALADDHGS